MNTDEREEKKGIQGENVERTEVVLEVINLAMESVKEGRVY